MLDADVSAAPLPACALGRALCVAPGLLDRAAQEELDLRIEAAQIVVRPALDGFQQGRVDTKQKRFTFGHGLGPGSRLPVPGSRH